MIYRNKILVSNIHLFCNLSDPNDLSQLDIYKMLNWNEVVIEMIPSSHDLSLVILKPSSKWKQAIHMNTIFLRIIHELGN